MALPDPVEELLPEDLLPSHSQHHQSNFHRHFPADHQISGASAASSGGGGGVDGHGKSLSPASTASLFTLIISSTYPLLIAILNFSLVIGMWIIIKKPHFRTRFRSWLIRYRLGMSLQHPTSVEAAASSPHASPITASPVSIWASTNRVCCQPDQPVLLFIHGLGQDWLSGWSELLLSWIRNCQSAPNHHFPCQRAECHHENLVPPLIAIDLPCHEKHADHLLTTTGVDNVDEMGGMRRARLERYSDWMDRLARQICGSLAQCSWWTDKIRLHLVGSDWGAVLATRLANNYFRFNQISLLTLIGPFGFPPNTWTIEPREQQYAGDVAADGDGDEDGRRGEGERDDRFDWPIAFCRQLVNGDYRNVFPANNSEQSAALSKWYYNTPPSTATSSPPRPISINPHSHSNHDHPHQHHQHHQHQQTHYNHRQHHNNQPIIVDGARLLLDDIIGADGGSREPEIFGLLGIFGEQFPQQPTQLIWGSQDELFPVRPIMETLVKTWTENWKQCGGDESQHDFETNAARPEFPANKANLVQHAILNECGHRVAEEATERVVQLLRLFRKNWQLKKFN